MTYVTLYLRAGNAGALASACPWLRGEADEGNRYWITSGPGFAFVPIGPFVLNPGDHDPETGEELTPPVIDDRFHANLRCTEDIAALVPETVRVNPTNPSRVWA